MDSPEIHFLTKKQFAPLVSDNPMVDRLWTIQKSTKEVRAELKTEKFDWVIDLHRNIRTMGLKFHLLRPTKSFKKLNFSKWLLVNLKMKNMPKVHIVDRYIDTLAHLGVKNDQKKGDFFIHPDSQVNLSNYQLSEKGYLTVAIGAKFKTKCLPTDRMVEVLQQVEMPIVLLGGPEDHLKAQSIVDALQGKPTFNLCGAISIQQSASFLQQSAGLLTHDTGLMHIAACFEVPIVSVWGNTVPELGMTPYRPQKLDFTIHQVENLKCRPCSKIGFQDCPKGHFNCMNQQDFGAIVQDLKAIPAN